MDGNSPTVDQEGREKDMVTVSNMLKYLIEYS